MRIHIQCTQDHDGAIFDGKCEECRWAWHASREYTEAEIISLIRSAHEAGDPSRVGQSSA